MSAAKSPAEADIKKKDVEDALARALRSECFAQTPQLSEFLTYVVNRKLEGAEDQIKAYTIAVDALGYPEDFDPQTNAAVRVMAGRLRKTLGLHNATPDAMEARVKISLAPGSYVPVFENRALSPEEADHSAGSRKDEESTSNVSIPGEIPITPAPAPLNVRMLGILVSLAVILMGGAMILQSSWFQEQQKEPGELTVEDASRLPTLSASLVIPEKSYPQWFKKEEFMSSLSVAISRFDDYRYVGIDAFKAFPPRGDMRGDYHLTFTAHRSDNDVRLFGQIIRLHENVTIWSGQKFFSHTALKEEFDMSRYIGRVLSALASPYGVIYSDLVRQKKTRPNMRCLIEGYRYFNRETDERHQVARACAEKLIKQGSQLPTLYAMLTFLYLDEYRGGRNLRGRDPLKAAKKTAVRAVELGPQSARAHEALFAVHKVQHHVEQARKSGKKAVKLNPYDSDIVGDLAAWLISIGEIDKGLTLMSDIDALLTAKPAWLEFHQFLAAELTSDESGADRIARLLDMNRSALSAIAVAISADRHDDKREVELALAALRKMEPGFFEEPVNHFLRRGFSEKVALEIARKLKNAGADFDKDVLAKHDF